MSTTQSAHQPPAVETPPVKVGTSGIIFNARNPDQFLIGKRTSESHGTNTWQLPGGHLDFGEGVLEGAAREVEEETLLKVEARGIVAVTNDVFRDVNPMKHYITLFIACEMKEPDAVPVLAEPEKCSEWRWETWEGLKERRRNGEALFLPLENLLDQKSSLDQLRPRPGAML